MNAPALMTIAAHRRARRGSRRPARLRGSTARARASWPCASAAARRVGRRGRRASSCRRPRGSRSPEQVQVGPGQQQHDVADCVSERSSQCLQCRGELAAGSTPRHELDAAGPSSTNVSPPTRLLVAAPSAASSSSASTPAGSVVGQAVGGDDAPVLGRPAPRRCARAARPARPANTSPIATASPWRRS